MSQVAVLAARVRLPEVTVPPGDAAGVRQQGAVLSTAGGALEQIAWRLQADGAAMRAARRWCGAASAEYQRVAAGRHDQVALAGRVLALAGQTCRQYAHALDQAQGRALQAMREAERLVRECDDLADACRRYESDRARAVGALASPVQAGELLAGARVADAELLRLQAWADRIDAAAVRVAADAREADRNARAAADAAGQEFDAMAALTTAARAAADRRQRDSLVAAGLLPGEDGSAGSRVTGLVDALGEDVTGPVALTGGLVGIGDSFRDSWSRLGQGVGRAVTHPRELLGTVLDTQDVQQGDWGHWAGTVLPGVLLTTGSGGVYGVARGIHSADLIAASARIADELRRAQDMRDLDELVRFNLLIQGRPTSALVPGGGLVWHEAAGGHAIARHVGLTVEQLRERIARYRLGSASSFFDRYTAEQAVAEAMDRQAGSIAQWLGGGDGELSLFVEMRRVVGITVRKNSPFVTEATRIKLVLVRAPDSPVGFILFTAFPTP